MITVKNFISYFGFLNIIWLIVLPDDGKCITKHGRAPTLCLYFIKYAAFVGEYRR